MLEHVKISIKRLVLAILDSKLLVTKTIRILLLGVCYSFIDLHIDEFLVSDIFPGKGVKRFSTGVGPQAPKARKKSSGILSSFSGFFRSIFGSSEEEEDSFEKDLSNRGVLHASNSDKTMSSSSDIIYEGRNHSPDVLCTSSKKSVLKHQPKQLELEESQDEEEVHWIVSSKNLSFADRSH